MEGGELEIELSPMGRVRAQFRRPSASAKRNRSWSNDPYAHWARGKPLTAAVAPVVATLRSDRVRAMGAIVLFVVCFVRNFLFFVLAKKKKDRTLSSFT